MRSGTAKLIVAIAIIVAGFGSVFALSRYLAGIRPPLPSGFEDHDLALQGAKLRGFALGMEGLAADWYWMQALQYLGHKVSNSKGEAVDVGNLRPLNPRLLYPYLDNATDLDPRFVQAYSFGALVLPAIDADNAIALSKKGIENNPGEWRLYQYLGYTYWRLERFEEASETYEQGSRVEGAPGFMRLMAASLKNKAGSRETARIMYRQMYEQGTDETSKYYAGLRLLEMDSLDERDGITKALETFRQRHGRCVANWNELIPIIREIKLPEGRNFRVDATGNPVDPSGAAYLLEPAGCTVGLGPDSKVPRG